MQLKEAYEQMQAQPGGSQGMSDESGTDNESKVGGASDGTFGLVRKKRTRGSLCRVQNPRSATHHLVTFDGVPVCVGSSCQTP